MDMVGGDDAARAVARLHAGLSAGQRAAICWPWNHADREEFFPPRFAAHHGQVGRPGVAGNVFTPAQQALIRHIVRALLNPAWLPVWDRHLPGDGRAWGEPHGVAIFGTPNGGGLAGPNAVPWQFLFSGPRIALRVGQAPGPEVAFGGPITYGHAASGPRESPADPADGFWPQAMAAGQFFQALRPAQRQAATVAQLPDGPAIRFGGPRLGLPLTSLTGPQRAAFALLLRALLAPFRAADRASALRCLAAQGGAERLHIAVRATRLPWQNDWRLEGPSFVWQFQAWPHLQAWAHIAACPANPSALFPA